MPDGQSFPECHAKKKHAFIELSSEQDERQYTALKKKDMEQRMCVCVWLIEYLHVNAHLLNILFNVRIISCICVDTAL